MPRSDLIRIDSKFSLQDLATYWRCFVVGVFVGMLMVIFEGRFW
jgi:hypothetical protein